jgi:AraC-like DNA-binding protein
VFYIGLSIIAFPLIYLYLHSLTLGRKKSKYLIINFIPAILVIFPGSFFYFLLDYNTRIEYLLDIEKNIFPTEGYQLFLSVFFNFFKIIYLLQSIFYVIKIRNILNKHQQSLNSFYSDSAAFSLNWVKSIFWIMIIWAFFALLAYIFILDKLNSGTWVNFIIDLSISILIGLFYILASMQKSIKEPVQDEYVPRGTFNHNTLKNKLIQVFEEKKIFLKKELTIWDVCRETNSNRTYISRFINEEYGMNFNCFVNKYRVDMAILLMRYPEYFNKSNEKIASLCGFNSLASFNRAFKKITNNNPKFIRSKYADKDFRYVCN